MRGAAKKGRTTQGAVKTMWNPKAINVEELEPTKTTPKVTNPTSIYPYYSSLPRSCTHYPERDKMDLSALLSGLTSCWLCHSSHEGQQNTMAGASMLNAGIKGDTIFIPRLTSAMMRLLLWAMKAKYKLVIRNTIGNRSGRPHKLLQSRIHLYQAEYRRDGKYCSSSLSQACIGAAMNGLTAVHTRICSADWTKLTIAVHVHAFH